MNIYISIKGSQEMLLRTPLGINGSIRSMVFVAGSCRRLRSGTPLYVTRSGNWLKLEICREATRLDLIHQLPPELNTAYQNDGSLSCI